jgi:hypothetical protein
MRKEIEEESTSILQLAGVPASRLRSLYAAFGQSKTKLDTLESHFKGDFQKASHFYLWSQSEPSITLLHQHDSNAFILKTTHQKLPWSTTMLVTLFFPPRAARQATITPAEHRKYPLTPTTTRILIAFIDSIHNSCMCLDDQSLVRVRRRASSVHSLHQILQIVMVRSFLPPLIGSMLRLCSDSRGPLRPPVIWGPM